MSAIEIDTSDVDRWLNNSSGRNRAKSQFISRFVIDAENKVKDKARGISASRRLDRSIEGRTEGFDRGVVLGADYALIALETGRGPGGLPPVGALERWGERKLGKRGMGFALARTIATSGTRKYRRGGPKLLTEAMRELETDLDMKLLPNLAESFVE